MSIITCMETGGRIARRVGRPLAAVSESDSKFGAGPLPHPATQCDYPMGGRVGERAGTDRIKLSAILFSVAYDQQIAFQRFDEDLSGAADPCVETHAPTVAAHPLQFH